MNKQRGINQGLSGAGKLLVEARQLFTTGRADQAESILLSVLAQNPREIQAVVALGMVAAETGRIDLAISRMRQALELDPRCPPALCWLSLLLLQTDQVDAARRYAEQTISVAPQIPAGHLALARCLVRQGTAAASLPHFEKAIELNPGDPTILYEFADALVACRFWIQATQVLRKAVAALPNTTGLLRLAYFELRFGKIEDAEEHCQQALVLEPDFAEAHVLMARIRTEELRIDEAEVHWDRANELGSKPGFISIEKALSLSAIGRFDQAIAQLKQSITDQPEQGEAYQALTFAKRVVQDDLPTVRQMEELISSNSLIDSDRLNVLYSLGKSYDNLGDYERAIDFFDRANSLKQSMNGAPKFDRAALKARIDGMIQMFSKKLYAEARQAPSESSLPLAIVGMMRSGTTFLEQLLSCHPQIGGAGEQHYWGDNEASMIDLARRNINSGRLRTCAKEYVELLSSIDPGFPFVIDKNPANILTVGSLHLALPNMKIIHTRRSAIDTALSIWMTPMNTSADFVSDRENIVFAYKQIIRLMDHWRDTLPEDRFTEVRYEDLVKRPQETTPRLVKFMGLEWNDACLHPELNERRVRTPSLWQVRQPIYQSSTERWKKYEPWLGVFEELHGLS